MKVLAVEVIGQRLPSYQANFTAIGLTEEEPYRFMYNASKFVKETVYVGLVNESVACHVGLEPKQLMVSGDSE